MTNNNYEVVFDILNEETQILNSVEDIINSLPVTSTSGIPTVTYESLITNETTVNGNVRIGTDALKESVGENNTAIGFESLKNNMTGIGNTGVGFQTLTKNTTGSYNNALGSLALNNNETGNFNIAVGAESLKNNTTGSNNIGIGCKSLRYNVTGYNNIALGAMSQLNNLNGSNNISIGAESMANITEGDCNISIGQQAMKAYCISTSCNTAVGKSALERGNNAYNNTVFGGEAAQFVGNGINNFIVGNKAFNDASNASNNVCIGNFAMLNSASSTNCISLGHYSMQKGGKNNIAIGWATQISGSHLSNNNITIGVDNFRVNKAENVISIGNDMFKNVIPDSSNNAIQNLYNTNGEIISVGNSSLENYDFIDDNSNIYCFGYKTMYNSKFYSNSEEINSAIGSYACENLKYPILCASIGYNSNYSSSLNPFTVARSYAVGANSLARQNTVTLGDSSVTRLRCATSTITTYSDEKDKTDIESINDGLELINRLEVKKFKWDKREWYGYNGEFGIPTGKKKDSKVNVGFLAQDVLKAQEEFKCDYLNLVNKTDENRLEINTMNLLIPLVNSIKDLSKKNKILKERLEVLINSSK